MYRQNKLKEELDRLRDENRRLAFENVYLRERNNTLQAELYNVRLQMQNDSLHDTLIQRTLTERPIIRIEKERME